ncbi:MAG: InlB B-repeat-containing protein [Nitrososphaerales archaeon]
MTIGATSDGSVSYSYANSGSSQVTAQASVYVPAGTDVTLNANPSSLFYKLSSWNGAVTGSDARASLTVNSPSTAEAQFGYNLVNIGGIIAIIVIALTAIAVLLMRRKPARTHI